MNDDAPIVLKFGGSNFAPEALDPFAAAVARFLVTGRRLVVVHGGGKDLSVLLERLGEKPQFVEGLRVTDAATLDAAELVLSGRVNKRITRALQRAGVPAVGIAGTDGNLVQATVRRQTRRAADGQMEVVDIGRVGDVVRVDKRVLDALSSAGFVPVVSPLGIGSDGEALNVNADTAAAAIAAALGAELRLVTNVPGILNGPDAEPLSAASAQAVESMKDAGIIRDGMIPKVDACLDALRQGAPLAFIQSLDSFIRGSHVGTRISLE